MTEDESKKIRVELDHEQKVIHLGCWFYDLKGVLIAEATEEDKKKYYCGKFMTPRVSCYREERRYNPLD